MEAAGESAAQGQGEAAQLLLGERVLPAPRQGGPTAAARAESERADAGASAPGLGGLGAVARWARSVRQAAARAVPLLEWGPRYRAEWLAGDVAAGLTIASLAVPQDLGYASLARVPGQNGLYASVLPPMVYAALGSSHHIAIGPTAVVSLLLASLIQSQAGVDSEEQPALHLQLALTCTFFAGVWQAAMGALGLGFLLDCLSHAVIVGFMAGACVTIALQQLKGLLGFTTFTSATDVVGVLLFVARNMHHTNWRAVLIGLSFLAALASLRVLALSAKENKRLRAAFFFLGAMGPMLTVLIASLAVRITACNEPPANVPVTRQIPQGLPRVSAASQLHLTGPYASRAAVIGFVVAIIALTEAIAIARTFAARGGYRINASQEMIAYGAMNMAAALTSGIATTGSFSRSAVNHQAGAQTMLSNIVMSAILALVLLLVAGIFRYLPSAALSAIIVNAVLGLIDIPEIARVWNSDKLDFLVLVGTLLGTMSASVELGLLVGVCTSMLRVLPHVPWYLSRAASRLAWSSTKQRKLVEHANTEGSSGILLLSLDCPLIFTTAEYIHSAIADAVNEYHRRGLTPLTLVILDLASVVDIDTTGLSLLQNLLKELEARDFRLALANPPRTMLKRMQASGLLDNLGRDNLFPSAQEAMQILSQSHREVELGHICQANQILTESS